MGGFRRESESCKLQGPLGDVCGEVCLEVLPAGLQLGQQWVGLEGGQVLPWVGRLQTGLSSWE